MDIMEMLNDTTIDILILKTDGTIIKKISTTNNGRIHYMSEYIKNFKVNIDTYILCNPDKLPYNLVKQLNLLTTINFRFLLCDDLHIMDPRMYKLIPDHYLIQKNLDNDLSIIKKHTLQFHKRSSVCFFRGSPSGTLIKDNEVFTNRRIKCTVSFRDNPDFDIGLVENCISEKDLYENYNLKFVSRVHPKEYCKYKFCLSLDGFVSAWKRPAEIMFAGAVLLMQHSYEQYFYDKLIDGYNYIRIDDSLSNLEEKLTFLKDNPTTAETIAKNGRLLAEQIFNEDSIKKTFKEIIES